jgi:hypothetical protein
MLQQIRDQENVRVGVKALVVGAPPPAATKRSALGEIGNDRTAGRALGANKVGGSKLHAPVQK